MPAADVLIVGGGVIGLSVARELSRRGHAVTLLDRTRVGDPTGPASWAGAGMLPPADPAHAAAPRDRLRGLSHRLWDGWAGSLTAETGIPTGYERHGLLELCEPGEVPADRLASHRLAGVICESLTPRETSERVLGLPADSRAGVLLTHGGQVRNPWLLRALLAACVAGGVTVREGVGVRAVLVTGDRVGGVETETGERVPAGVVVLCGGAWAGSISVRDEAGRAGPWGATVPVRPVRGQMALLNLRARPFRPVLECGPRYLVPRADGRVLVGATQEEAGFEARPTAAGIGGLLAFAKSLIPSLGEATVEKTWAGLRPGTPDGCPLLGAAPRPAGGTYRNLYLAAGHFRDGLQQSPGTAVVLADMIEDREPTIPLDGLRADRFAGRGRD